MTLEEVTIGPIDSDIKQLLTQFPEAQVKEQAQTKFETTWEEFEATQS